MNRIFTAAILLVLFAGGLFAQTITPEGDVTVKPLMVAQGFAFQGKEFKTLRMAIINDTENTQQTQGQSQEAKLTGMLLIGGFEYKLMVVIFEDAKLEADLFCKPESSEQALTDKEKKAELPVPVGHVSITLNQPDPSSVVWLGKLQLKDEKVEAVSGEFELYLNDNTPKKIEAPEK